MRKNIIQTGALVALMFGLLAIAGCQYLQHVPAPVWEHGLRIAGAIGREYVAKRYDLDDITREAVNAALRELGIEELPADEVPEELRQAMRVRLRNAGYMGDELDAMTEAGSQYLLTRFELADIIDQGVANALEATGIVIGGEPIPSDFELFIRMELGEAGYSVADIDVILEQIYPEPNEVAALAASDPRLNTSYARAVARGLRLGE